ncbi:hypothetical protein J2T13_001646 [Paenibacillus sp. DS2015]|uniref:hypothetical protein n=1 Tax=Paenibacillus sp. DS2015 TaxID=3373917 RepID=UPI003D20902F
MSLRVPMPRQREPATLAFTATFYFITPTKELHEFDDFDGQDVSKAVENVKSWVSANCNQI